MSRNTTAGTALAAALVLAVPALAAATSRFPSPCALATANRPNTPSTRCMTCHDGTAAPAVGSSFSRGTDKHPVGVRYTTARDGVSLRVAPSDPRVQLVHGEVACTTCHDGRSPERNHLAVATRRLCTSCHDR